MAPAAEGRGGEGKRRRRTAAANLPARSPGAREWSPRHDEPPGGNDEGPPATQNISPQPSGAGRALQEPPAPLAAARSRPQGRQSVRASPVRVRGLARVPVARLLSDTRARCWLVALPPSRPRGSHSAGAAPGGRVRRCLEPGSLPLQPEARPAPGSVRQSGAAAARVWFPVASQETQPDGSPHQLNGTALGGRGGYYS